MLVSRASNRSGWSYAAFFIKCTPRHSGGGKGTRLLYRWRLVVSWEGGVLARPKACDTPARDKLEYSAPVASVYRGKIKQGKGVMAPPLPPPPSPVYSMLALILLVFSFRMTSDSTHSSMQPTRFLLNTASIT